MTLLGCIPCDGKQLSHVVNSDSGRCVTCHVQIDPSTRDLVKALEQRVDKLMRIVKAMGANVRTLAEMQCESPEAKAILKQAKELTK